MLSTRSVNRTSANTPGVREPVNATSLAVWIQAARPRHTRGGGFTVVLGTVIAALVME